nr:MULTISPECIES: adenylyl-sulfate kinase [unclassified Pseudomonas]
MFIDAPLHVLELRDPKGLYAKARKGLIKNFTGIDSPYERPEAPEIVIDSTTSSIEQAAHTIESFLKRQRVWG